MVYNGSSTKLFVGVGLAVPRLGNVRLRLHFLRRGTSGAKTNANLGGRSLRHIKLIQEPIYEGYSESDLASGYRYGFNTQQKQDDIYGPGNQTTALYWEYDTRLGRRWNLDPVVIPYISRYATLENNPIWWNDIDGNCINCPVEAQKMQDKTSKNKVNDGETWKDANGQVFKFNKGLGWIPSGNEATDIDQAIDQAKDIGEKTLNVTSSVVGMAGGVAQIAAGLAMASTPTGIGQVAGALLITNGIIEFGLSFASLTYNISTGGESANGLPGSLGGVGALVVARTNNYTEAETDAAINSADFGFSLVTGAGLKGVMKRSAAAMAAGSKASKTMDAVKKAEKVIEPADIATSSVNIGVSVYKTNKERNKNSKTKKR